MINTIEVRYKGEPVGALSYNKGDTAARFEYLSEFVEKNIPLAQQLDRTELLSPLERLQSGSFRAAAIPAPIFTRWQTFSYQR